MQQIIVGIKEDQNSYTTFTFYKADLYAAVTSIEYRPETDQSPTQILYEDTHIELFKSKEDFFKLVQSYAQLNKIEYIDCLDSSDQSIKQQ